jgi:hypothetical protein
MGSLLSQDTPPSSAITLVGLAARPSETDLGSSLGTEALLVKSTEPLRIRRTHGDGVFSGARKSSEGGTMQVHFASAPVGRKVVF